MSSVRSLLVASRPFSWINTGLPFLAAALSVKLSASPTVVVGTLYFLGPYNLLLYGVNDLFDYQSDRLNPRKGGRIEGARLDPGRGRLLWFAIAVTNLPLLAVTAALGGWGLAGALTATVAAALAYSTPPLRTKVIPVLDSLTSSSHFVLPAVCGLLAAGLPLQEFPGRILVAFFLWGAASHALGAIQDVRFDRAAGIGSVATAFSARPTAGLATVTYAAAALALGLGGGLEALAAVVVIPYVLLAASCLVGDPERQSRRAWRGFMGMNLLAGFFITQLLLRQWGVEHFSPLDLAWAPTAAAGAMVASMWLCDLSLRRRAVPERPGPTPRRRS